MFHRDIQTLRREFDGIRGVSGFIQVLENLESHGIFYFHFQAWKVMEKQYAWQKDILETDELETGFNFSTNGHKHTLYAL